MFRSFLDFFIYLSSHSLLVFGTLFVFLSLLALPRIVYLTRFFEGLRHFSTKSVFGLVFLFFAVFLGIGAWYLSLPGYAGEVEPMISSVSWLVSHGKPLYHGLDDSVRYSVLYGPSVYLTNGLFLKVFGASLASTKLASLLASLLGLAFLYGALARRKNDLVAALAVLLAVFYFWAQGFSIYLVRPDAFLVFAVCFALFALQRTSRWLAVIAVGTALGFAANLKIHAPLYFLPLGVLFLRRHGGRRFIQALALALMVTFSPFLAFPQISLTNYLLWLREALGHGLCLETLPATSRFGALLLLPLLTVTLLDEEKGFWWLKDRLLGASLALALGGTLVLSTKPGAGLVHLLPLIPSFIFLPAEHLLQLPGNAWEPMRKSSRRLLLGRGALGILFITMFLTGSVHAYRSSMLVGWQNRNASDLVRDIEGIMVDNPGVTLSMACGGENEFFHNTYARPLLVFNNNPLLIDPIAVMDCCKAGVGLSENTFTAIKRGTVGAWLVPRGQKPFQKANWYTPHEEIFPERFLDCFLENYSPQDHSKYFDLWYWNGLQRPPTGNPAVAAKGSVKTAAGL